MCVYVCVVIHIHKTHMHVHVYIMVQIISHLGCVCVCVCVSVCTQASEVPLVMHSEICPAAVSLNSCSLHKGSLSSSAPIPLKTNLSVSVCFSFLSSDLI